MRRGRFGYPPRIGGRGNGVHREARNRHVISMAIHTVWVERDHEMRLMPTDMGNQLRPDSVQRCICELLVLVVEKVHFRNTEETSCVTELSLAESR